MPIRSLNEELDAIAAGAFDYGIVPGSATVFVRDKLKNMGRFDLTLLEGVLVVIDVTAAQGYMVTSCSALSSAGLSVSTARTVQSHMNAPFESMESLLLAISPVFCQRFQEYLLQKLQTTSCSSSGTTDAAIATAAAAAAAHAVTTGSSTKTMTSTHTTFGGGGGGVGSNSSNHIGEEEDDAIDQLLRKEQQKSASTAVTTSDNTNSNTSNNKNSNTSDDINEWIHQH